MNSAPVDAQPPNAKSPGIEEAERPVLHLPLELRARIAAYAVAGGGARALERRMEELRACIPEVTPCEALRVNPRVCLLAYHGALTTRFFVWNGATR
jgi:hypothetical protein